ncbi:histidine phosphatase family protein [Agriterribacter sp.]|uniref:SixA phosphatase family protein n=1 Tax=Agriterribacter sp. TaxID=2821509 RepID=UPI002BA06A78|nr:histidine phosphatase family protein [Agriterribacter sp.]HRP55080.1 histidine phosphatase family protein [Agriterribacter sp.]
MRSVLFIRHAKSSWDDASVSDFDRSLNERGKKDAQEMARRLISRRIPLDSFISSPAKRARKTAGFFIKAYELPESALVLKAELYLPLADVFYEVIEGIANDFHHLAICSHNPAITHLVNLLTSEIKVDNVPTCGIFAIKTDIGQWHDFRKAPKQFWFFDYPKNHV